VSEEGVGNKLERKKRILEMDLIRGSSRSQPRRKKQMSDEGEKMVDFALPSSSPCPLFSPSPTLQCYTSFFVCFFS